MQFERPKQSTIRPINYAQLNNLWNSHLRDHNQAEASIEPKWEFAVRVCKINIGSNTFENY